MLIRDELDFQKQHSTRNYTNDCNMKVNATVARGIKRYSPAGAHTLTTFRLRPLVDVVELGSLGALEGREGFGLGLVCEASTASSLCRLSGFFGSGMASFSWGRWSPLASLLDLFFLCCRSRFRARFCFCRCGDVSLEARYPELGQVPSTLVSTSRTACETWRQVCSGEPSP